jgi:hypothetical protein
MANPSAADIGSRRRKDWVLLRSYLFGEPNGELGKVDVIKSSFDYVGIPKISGRKHFTGIYGTNSGDAGGFLASNWASRNDKQVYFLDVWAEIPNFHSSRAQMTRQILQESHWLHLDRMSVDLRDEIKDSLLGWVKRKFGPEERQAIEKHTVQQILLKYPEFAVKLLDDDSDLGMIVHPIYTSFDKGEGRQLSLWAATIRTDRISIKGAEIRYLPEIECIIKV